MATQAFGREPLLAVANGSWSPRSGDTVRVAGCHPSRNATPGVLLSAALPFHSWLETGGQRPPIRAALIRHWVRRGLLRIPVPVTGPRALSVEAPQGLSEWVCCFLHALAAEAGDYHQLLRDMERAWQMARRTTAGRRSTSRAALAIDVLAAAPLLSATTLARAAGMSIKSATVLLDGFVAEEIAVEVTHRSARRLFGLRGMAPVRDTTTGPRRPEPGRGRGRPPLSVETEIVETPSAPPPPAARFEWPAIDYAALEAAMAQCDEVIRSSKQRLDQWRRGHTAGAVRGDPGDQP